jgi:hypothetical protein
MGSRRQGASTWSSEVMQGVNSVKKRGVIVRSKLIGKLSLLKSRYYIRLFQLGDLVPMFKRVRDSTIVIGIRDSDERNNRDVPPQFGQLFLKQIEVHLYIIECLMYGLARAWGHQNCLHNGRITTIKWSMNLYLGCDVVEYEMKKLSNIWPHTPTI